MAFFSGISTQKRDSASEADGGELFRGAAFIAAGVLAASFMTMEIASVVKLGLLAAGGGTVCGRCEMDFKVSERQQSV